MTSGSTWSLRVVQTTTTRAAAAGSEGARGAARDVATDPETVVLQRTTLVLLMRKN